MSYEIITGKKIIIIKTKTKQKVFRVSAIQSTNRSKSILTSSALVISDRASVLVVRSISVIYYVFKRSREIKLL